MSLSPGTRAGEKNSGTNSSVPGRPETKCTKIFQKNDFIKQNIWSFLLFFKIHFVPGRPRTEEFVPGHLLLPLSRDKGTAGQAKLFCPGTQGQRDRQTFLSRDKGTTGRPAGRFVLWKSYTFVWLQSDYRKLLCNFVYQNLLE